MQAKIFGGAQVMHSFTTMNVGERNTQFVVNYLHTERIPVVSEDVLDIYPRKVCFFLSPARPWSNAWLMHIRRSWWPRRNAAMQPLWHKRRRVVLWTCFD